MEFSEATGARASKMLPQLRQRVKKAIKRGLDRGGDGALLGGASKNDRGNGKYSRMAGMGCLRARKWVKGNKSSKKKGMAGRKNRGESGNDSAQCWLKRTAQTKLRR